MKESMCFRNGDNRIKYVAKYLKMSVYYGFLVMELCTYYYFQITIFLAMWQRCLCSILSYFLVYILRLQFIYLIN